MSFVIFQINTNLLINQLNKIFLHKTPYAPPSFQQKTCALHCRCFQKYPLFTTFLLVFTVNEVCYISNKYHPPNNLTKHQYFYRRDLIPLFHFEKKIGAVHRVHFSKHLLLTPFSLFLTMSELCNISNKYRLPNKSYKQNIFTQRFDTLHSSFILLIT